MQHTAESLIAFAERVKAGNAGGFMGGVGLYHRARTFTTNECCSSRIGEGDDVVYAKWVALRLWLEGLDG